MYISGFVQGVGYRHFVKRNARKLGVVGWVKNLPDGRVEAFLQGQQNIIEQMLVICRKGPFLAEVEDVQVVWEDVKEEYKDFVVTSD